MDAPLEAKIRGYSSFASISLTYQLTPNIFIEPGYNYLCFRQRKDSETTFMNLGAEGLVPNQESTPYTAWIKKGKMDIYGPLLSVKCRF